jgi:hypothetical protein
LKKTKNIQRKNNERVLDFPPLYTGGEVTQSNRAFFYAVLLLLAKYCTTRLLPNTIADAKTQTATRPFGCCAKRETPRQLLKKEVSKPKRKKLTIFLKDATVFSGCFTFTLKLH